MSFGERLDKAIAPFAPGWALRRREARQRLSMSSGQFRAASSTRLNADWVLGVDDPDPSSWELRQLRSYCRDLNRNNAIAAGATDTIGLNVVGQGLRPQARLRAEALGLGEDRAEALRRQMEAAWQLWSPRADSGNRMTFDWIQYLVIRKLVEDGEVLAVPSMASEPWRRIRRVVELIEVDRLGGGAFGRAGVPANGVEVGERGEPVAYHVRRQGRKPGEKDAYAKIKAHDDKGRPGLMHLFMVRRPGQQRGYPIFAPVIETFQNLGKYIEAEVVAKRISACLAVYITKQDAAAEQAAMTAETDAAGRRQSQIEPGMVGYLEPGEGVQEVDPRRPGDSFEPFLLGALRHICMGLGLPYELVVKDFSRTNYSSARAALLEGRRMFSSWRHWLAGSFCDPVWALVQEEAVLRGMVDIPYDAFMENRAEYCRAAWIGGGWGWVDPVKEVQASKLAIENNLSTHADECAAQGRDWEEVAEQRSRENRRKQDLGLGGEDAEQ